MASNSRVSARGVMSGLQQFLQRMAVICFAVGQITCSKIMIVGKSESMGQAIDRVENMSCFSNQPNNETLFGRFCIMTVTERRYSTGNCSASSGKTHSFNITKHDGEYKVLMREKVTDITLWFFPDELKCLPSDILKETGGFPFTCRCALTGSLNNSFVDPGKACDSTTDSNSSCDAQDGQIYNLSVKGNESKCVKCSKPAAEAPPTQDPNKTPRKAEMIIHPHETDLCSTPGVIKSSAAAKVLDKLENISNSMSNTSTAAIVMDDVIGVIQKQDKTRETRETYISYSSDENEMKFAEHKSAVENNFPWYVKISKEAFDLSQQENNGSGFVGVLRFKNMETQEGDGDAFHTILNNVVYGITMGANISNLTDKIEIFFRLNNTVGNLSCVSWDGGDKKVNWTTSGCKTENNNNIIKCSCCHLTFFALLLSAPNPNPNATAPHVKSLTYISYIGCGLSMFFLGVALFMHFLLRKAQSNQATKILMNLLAALFLLNLSFLSNESIAKSQDNSACVFAALVMHFSMLATFTWFFIQALHIYLWLIRQNVTIKHYMKKVTVAGWVLPAVLVLIVVSLGEYKAVNIQSTETTTQMCWITNPYIHYTVNIGYYALVFIFTAGIFITITTKIIQARNVKVGEDKRNSFKKQLALILSLFVLLGLTWAVAFFSYGPMLIPSYYIFCLLNSFQGFFLFLYYYHIHKDVEGRFSDDSNTENTQSSINKENIQNSDQLR